MNKNYLVKSVTLERLRLFADVATLGSFTAAAERAGLTQPAVSQQIRALERALGVRLVERVGRRARPTAAGAALLARARRVEDAVADAVAAVAPHRSGLTGRVRIGTGATACIYLLPPLLGRVKARLPGLEITVRTGNTPDILALLDANALDLAVVTLPAPGRSFDVSPLCEDPLVAVFPGDAEAPAPVTPAALAAHPLLLYEGGHTRRLVDQWLAAGGEAPTPVMELGSVEAIRRLVGAGLGWAVLPRLALADADRIGWRPLAPPLARTLALVLRRDKPLDRGLRAVIDALRDGSGAPAN